MPEYLSGKKRKQNIGISSYSENTDSLKVVGNILVSSGRVGVGTTTPERDLDVESLRIRDTIYDYTNFGGSFGYYLVKDTGGIKWVEVPPIDSNAIFIAENNNIIGVSSFTGINIISDELLGVSQNPINPNFADIVIIPRWARSGDSGIYTTKNVGIGTTIPTADFQVGFGTTGVTIDGGSGVVTAIGYFGKFADFNNLIVGLTTIGKSLDVIGLGGSEVSAYLASAGGITTTGGDLYVGGELFAGQIEIGNLKVEDINATGISTFNIANINVCVATDINVTGIATVNNLNVSGITSTKNVDVNGDIFVSENTTTQNLYAQTGIITNFTSEVSSIDSLTSIGATIETLDVSTIVGVSTLIGVGSAFFPEGSFDNLTSIAATITSLDVSNLVGVSATITSLNSTDIVGTAATITSLNFQSGIVTNLVSTSSTITSLRVQSGIVTNLVSTAGTFTTLNSTSGSFGNVQVSGIVTAPSFVGNLTGNADTADYADLSGISTNVIGGIASVTSLNVSGIASISELNVVDEFDVYANDSVFHQNVVIQGNLTVNGTEVIINVDEKFIKDRQIVLGFSTTNSVDDDTANGGGFAIASTEGSPLVSLYAVGVNTLPDTYKKLIWTKANTYGVGTTDAFMFNYAVGIGSTLVPDNVRLAVGGVQVTDDTVSAEFFDGDGSQLTSLDADNISSGTLDNERLPDNINISGIMTALDYYGTFKGTIDIGVIIENANYAKAAGVATYAVNAGVSTYADFTGISTYAVNAGISTNVIGGVASVTSLSVSDETQLGIVTATEYYGIFKGTIDNNVILETANYAKTAGVATYADFAGISTYAVNAGVATYADFAGISTNVIGGIASVTSLSVSGVTITNSLRVGTGGTIITTAENGNTGFGTTNPTEKLDVNGTIRISGGISVGGTTGTSGQVLKSTGIGLEWETNSTSTENYSSTFVGIGSTVVNSGDFTVETYGNSELTSETRKVVINSIDAGGNLIYPPSFSYIKFENENSTSSLTIVPKVIQDVRMEYRGFSAGINQLYGDDPHVNQLIIHKTDNDVYYYSNGETNNEDFTALGLDNSDVVASVVFYTKDFDDTNGGKETSMRVLNDFFRSFVDNVLYTNSGIGTIGDINTNFDNNIGILTSVLPPLYSPFAFRSNILLLYPFDGPNVSGVNGLIVIYYDNNNQLQVDFNHSGSGYQVGDFILISGDEFTNGSTPDNDVTVTLTSVGPSGEIRYQGFSISTPTSPIPTIFPTDSIQDGGDDVYDEGNKIVTDLYPLSGGDNVSPGIPYNDGQISVGTSYFGGGEYVTKYANSVFAMVSVGSSIKTLGFAGNWGADGRPQPERSQPLYDTTKYTITDFEVIESSGSWNNENYNVTIDFSKQEAITVDSFNNFFTPISRNPRITKGDNEEIANNILIGENVGEFLGGNSDGNILLGRNAGRGTPGAILTLILTSSTTLAGEANNTYEIYPKGGSGRLARIKLKRDENGDISFDGFQASVLDIFRSIGRGFGYRTGDVLTVSGSSVGGTDGDDDVTLTVDAITFNDSYNNDGNVFIGDGAGKLGIGGNSIFIGKGSGSQSSSSDSTFIGRWTGVFSTGSFNNFLGYKAGYHNTTGSHNTFLGSYTGISASASRKVIFGSGYSDEYTFDAPDTTKDTQFAVGVRTDANPANYWLVGDENFNIGIGVTEPQYKLDVLGDTQILGTLYVENIVSSNLGVVKYYDTLVGDGINTTYTLDHNLNTRDLIVSVYRNSGNYDKVWVETQMISNTEVVLIFGDAPGVDEFRVTIRG